MKADGILNLLKFQIPDVKVIQDGFGKGHTWHYVQLTVYILILRNNSFSSRRIKMYYFHASIITRTND